MPTTLPTSARHALRRETRRARAMAAILTDPTRPLAERQNARRDRAGSLANAHAILREHGAI